MFSGVVLKPTVEAPPTQAFLAFLRDDGLLSDTDVQRASQAAETGNTSLENLLLELGLVEEDALYAALSRFSSVPIGKPANFDTSLVDILGIDRDFFARVRVVPVAEENGTLVVATSSTDVGDVLRAIAFKLDKPVRATLATPSEISVALSRLRGSEAGVEASASADADRLRAMANEGPVIRLVNEMIGKASADGASDVHVEATEHGAIVRFRVDGTLREEKRFNEATKAAVVSRLKVLSNLNISEKRRPQDGRAGVTVRGRPIDLRLSTLPTQFGESVVIRLLDQRQLTLDWKALGYEPDKIETIRTLINRPNGIVLVAGPTGSGKTTTLYTALSELNSPDRKIVTVEDPIEYALDGVNQVQVETEIDMSFASALRAILRQDPDIVMVGEIRDQETAEIAVRAALVGRLVLSTVHTNDAVSAIARLVDLGVPRYLLSASLRGVVSQRLVRRVCVTCKGQGCISCSQNGTSGRVVVAEVLSVNDAIAKAISDGAETSELRDLMSMYRIDTLEQDGRRLIDAGLVRKHDIRQIL